MKVLVVVSLILATACGSTAGGGGTAITGPDTGDDTAVGSDAGSDATSAATDAAADDAQADVAPGKDATPEKDVAPGLDTLADAATDLDAVVPPDADTQEQDTAATDVADAADAAADAADTTADVKPPCSALTCDDGDPCTDDGCDASGACVHASKPGCGTTPVPCAVAKDCTKGTCDTGLHICVGCQSNADCGGAGLCIHEACVAAAVCVSDGQCKATNQVCDKAAGFCVDCVTAGDCKATESCVASKCTSTLTKCASSKDCPGILVCDKGAGVCVGCVAAGDCPTGQNCQASQCVAKICTAPVCQNGDVWNCNADGTGYVAAPTSCDDGLVCTTDLCVPGAGCAHATNAAACDDGDACTTGDTCAGGTCAAGTPTSCDDKNACTADSCQPALGCVHLASGATVCDDGSVCTTGDTCEGVQCVGKIAVTCDDGNACTADACDKSGCTHTPGAGACDDGNPCTIGDTCSGSICAAGAANSCDDGNTCTADSCDAKVGCVHVLKVGCIPVSLPPCATNTDCTGGTVCNVVNHTCVACVVDSTCGTGSVCIANACQKAVACVSDVQCKASKQVCDLQTHACVDCNAKTDCATGQACQANACVTVKACTSSKDCTKVCDQQNAVCVDCLSDADCTDAQFCGADHVCHADVCTGATCNGINLWSCSANGSGYSGAVSCNDTVMCTIDSCAAQACVHVGKFDPTAFEFPGNGLDDNCDGKTDDVPLCDTGLTSATPGDYAKALDLCTGISDLPIAASAQSHAVRGPFGSTFAPQSGANMVMLSTGIAAAEADAGYAAPQSGTDFGTTPTGVPTGKCSSASIHDATTLRVQVLIPTNATGMAFDFAFFSAEYPEYIGAQYSDGFAVVVQGAAYAGDVVGDANGKCFDPSDITFTSCAETTCTKGAAGLTGTGYEADVGGGYGWSTASFAVKAGDTVTIQFTVFDVGDGVYDTAVLLDSLRFTNAAVSTPTIVAK